MDIKDYGFSTDSPLEMSGIPARVTAVHRERYAIVCAYGETHARLKAKLYYGGSQAFPTTGDFVMVNYNPSGDSQIVATLPRKTFFSRRSPDKGRGEQAVAANFDYVFIMQSLNMNFNVKRLERYLTLAWQSGAVPVVLLTKADLVEDHSAYTRAAGRAASGADVHVVSTKNGFGLDGLSAYLKPGKTIVFLGSSGVGKSSLVNALSGEEIMDVSGIREADSRGRHTTTHRQLLMLKSGAMIIDTPGMRELGMWDVSTGLDETFPDVEALLGKCRFRDCSHTSEPGCAVRAAIDSGELDSARWESYRKLKAEAKYADEKDSCLREKHLRMKNLQKSVKQRKKEIW